VRDISLKDPFGKAIISVIKEHNFRHNLEIGSWDGLGSTQCLIKGMRLLQKPKSLYCLESVDDRYKLLVNNVKCHAFVKPVNMGSIALSDWLVRDFDADIWNSPYNKIKRSFPKDEVYSWYQHNVNTVTNEKKGFLRECKDNFDAVLIDGGVFTGYSEFVLLKDRTKCFFLDDVHKSFKCNQIYHELISDKNWVLLHDFPDVRNGACIFIKVNLPIRLFVSWYKDTNVTRNEDFLVCLNKNLKNSLIDFVHLIVDSSNILAWPSHSKIVVESYKYRPQYDTFFSFMKPYPEAVKILANSDIYFDDSLLYLKYLKADVCYVLTRWDIRNKKPVFLNRSWSQDAWIFRSHLQKTVGNFELGRLGCDGRIAYELAHAGYKVLNPSKTIKAFHLHSERKPGGLDGHDPALTIPHPRLRVIPTAIETLTA
jgi:hypothetical protein